jgi:hypothetical protein
VATIHAGAFHRRNFITQAFEALTVGAAPVALTAATYGSRRYAVITVDNGDIRFTVDGTPPSTTIGHTLSVADVLYLYSNEDLAKFRAVRMTTTDGLIQCSYGELKLTA